MLANCARKSSHFVRSTKEDLRKELVKTKMHSGMRTKYRRFKPGTRYIDWVNDVVMQTVFTDDFTAEVWADFIVYYQKQLQEVAKTNMVPQTGTPTVKTVPVTAVCWQLPRAFPCC